MRWVTHHPLEFEQVINSPHYSDNFLALSSFCEFKLLMEYCVLGKVLHQNFIVTIITDACGFCCNTEGFITSIL